MRVHYLSHVPFEKLGTMETWLEQRGARLSATRFYQGEPLPEPEQLDTLIVMGGPMGADDEARYPWMAAEKRFIEQCIAADKKVLGVCLGAQLIARVLGAPVTANPEPEIGWFPVQSTDAGRHDPIGALFDEVVGGGLGEHEARALCRECADELKDGPWIQSEAEMLADPARFSAAQRRLGRVLETFLEI